jgi:hypothetical protein
MKALGAEHIRLNNLSNILDHNSCAAFAVVATKYFFNRFRDKGKNHKMKDLPPFKKLIVTLARKSEERKYIKSKQDKAYH